MPKQGLSVNSIQGTFTQILRTTIDTDHEGFVLDPEARTVYYRNDPNSLGDVDEGPTLRASSYDALIAYVKALVGFNVKQSAAGMVADVSLDHRWCNSPKKEQKKYWFFLEFFENKHGEEIIARIELHKE